MQKKSYENAIKFYLLATKLKYRIRGGWDKDHWNINSERIESIAEHVYGTCILAISLDSEFELGIDLDKVIKMLVLHEIGEVLIGDITPFDSISKEEKTKEEHEAILKVLDGLVKKDELASLFFEFDAKETKEALFAYYCDKMEADLQSKIYQDMGCHHSLDDQEDNVVFKNPRAKQLVENGAKTAFDIWYEWDKSIYEDSPLFTKLLKYIKENNTSIQL